jgi:hypothetical protein
VTHDEARLVLERAVPGISPVESRLVRAISVVESHYGDGWTGVGRGSHNWGAITAGSAWRGATFEHRDSRWNPKTRRQESYTTQFRRYPSDEAGARDLYQMLTSGRHAVAGQLARQGRWAEISAAIGPRGTGYYGGHGPPDVAERAHQRRFLEALDDIGGASSSNLVWLLLAAALLWRSN